VLTTDHANFADDAESEKLTEIVEEEIEE